MSIAILTFFILILIIINNVEVKIGNNKKQQKKIDIFLQTEHADRKSADMMVEPNNVILRQFKMRNPSRVAECCGMISPCVSLYLLF